MTHTNLRGAEDGAWRRAQAILTLARSLLAEQCAVPRSIRGYAAYAGDRRRASAPPPKSVPPPLSGGCGAAGFPAAGFPK